MRRTVSLTFSALALGLATASPAGAAVPHTVQPGDTLWSIAASHNLTTRALATYNGVSETANVILGSTVQVPTEAEAAAALGAVGATGAPQQAAPASEATAPSAAPAPAGTRVDAATVQQVASEHGVPGSLAAAIAWQESGFNNRMVSSANARGVMQVVPGTWEWVQQNLAQRRLDPNSAVDNVHAGSLYLGQLLRETGGDPALAAASYYQGPASVRRIGMLPETRRYVDNVLALRSRFGG